MLLALSLRTAAAAETRFFESSGKKILLDYYPATSSRSTHRPILVLHGAGGMIFDGPDMRRMATHLSQEGYSVYLLHYFDRTGSLFFLGDSGMEKNFDIWLLTVRDAIAWVAREEERASSKPKTIGIFGYSLGAFLALASASDNSRVGAVAEQAGGMWNNNRSRIAKLPPTLLIHGRADHRVPFDKYSVPLMNVMRTRGTYFETKFYPGEGHRFSSTAEARVRSCVALFFRRQLD